MISEFSSRALRCLVGPRRPSQRSSRVCGELLISPESAIRYTQAKESIVRASSRANYSSAIGIVGMCKIALRIVKAERPLFQASLGASSSR